ncbi:MAG: magnesium transporter [Acidobacteria bacterium]|nr:magnesium transporter [Acidobacteriota bacterium]
MTAKLERIAYILEPLRKLLHRGAVQRVIKLMQKVHSADIARIMLELNSYERKLLFDILLNHNVKMVEEILREVSPEMAVELLGDLEISKITKILQELPSDDAAPIIEALPEDIAEQVLEQMRDQESEDLQGLLRYKEETAGRIMSTDFLALPQDTLVRDAIAHVQKSADVEVAFYLYVVSKYKHLLGVVSLRNLLLNPPDKQLKDIMTPDVISVRPDTDQEEVARIVARYNFLAVPVVDDENKLIGVVTVDDVIDIIRDEATEDFLKIAGLGDEAILRRSFLGNFLSKFPWLFVPWLGEIVAGYVINSFQATLSQIISLAAFIPIVMGMGGNIATQSSTIIVRGLATGRINLRNVFRVVIKEISVAGLLGLTYGVLLGFFTRLQFPSPVVLPIAVGLSIFLAMVVAAIVGSFGPLILAKVGADPAVASGPFVTTATDILGSFIYFSIATYILL